MYSFQKNGWEFRVRANDKRLSLGQKFLSQQCLFICYTAQSVTKCFISYGVPKTRDVSNYQAIINNFRPIFAFVWLLIYNKKNYVLMFNQWPDNSNRIFDKKSDEGEQIIFKWNCDAEGFFEFCSRFENQILMMTTLRGELKNSWEVTCNQRSAELGKIVQIKLKEIDELMDDNMELQAEVNEKRNQNDYLQKKLHVFRTFWTWSQNWKYSNRFVNPGLVTFINWSSNKILFFIFLSFFHQ